MLNGQKWRFLVRAVAAWICNWLKYRRQNVVLQRVLTLVPVLKLAGVALRAAFFVGGALRIH